MSAAVVDAALKVHKALGPGLLESAYEHCLAYELTRRGLGVARQVALPVRYDGLEIEAGYQIDLIIENSVIVEIKSVDALARIHEAQILTYLRLSTLRVGLLINFNVQLLKTGLRRFVV